jgi:hypothetical protein
VSLWRASKDTLKLSRLVYSRVYAFLPDATTETILVKTFVSLNTALAFLRDAVIFGRCIFTSRIFRRHHAGFGTNTSK